MKLLQEYHHISSAEMISILKLGNDPTHESPTLVPLVDSYHPDGKKHLKHMHGCTFTLFSLQVPSSVNIITPNKRRPLQKQ